MDARTVRRLEAEQNTVLSVETPAKPCILKGIAIFVLSRTSATGGAVRSSSRPRSLMRRNGHTVPIRLEKSLQCPLSNSILRDDQDARQHVHRWHGNDRTRMEVKCVSPLTCSAHSTAANHRKSTTTLHASASGTSALGPATVVMVERIASSNRFLS